MRRVSIYTGRDIGDWVHCPKDENKQASVSSCKKCSSHKGVKRQDPSNPFNYNREVLCSHTEKEV